MGRVLVVILAIFLFFFLKVCGMDENHMRQMESLCNELYVGTSAKEKVLCCC